MTEAEKRVRDAWAKMLETDASPELIDVAMGTKLGRLAVRLQERVDALTEVLSGLLKWNEKHRIALAGSLDDIDRVELMEAAREALEEAQP